ncbi:MAG: CHAT domain-containing protein [Candidatus Krumholzibacteriota bacterium]|nr:CHAT domain-containing protein [Candidatus Krumholzibacteriota bacterium]
MRTLARTAIAICAAAMVSLVDASSTGVGEASFGEQALTGSPIHILADSTLLETWRSAGKRAAARSFSAAQRPLFEHIESLPPENFSWMRREATRLGRLICAVEENDARLRFLCNVLSDQERGVAFVRARRLYLQCYRVLHESGDRPPGLLRDLHRCANEIDRLGAGGWSGWPWEAIADYHFSTGNPDSGLLALETAFEHHLLDDNVEPLAHVSSRIGFEFAQRRRFADADSLYALSLAYALRADDPFFVSRVHSFTGSLRAAEGYYVEAESLFACSIEACRLSRVPLCRISRQIDLARLYADHGEHTLARPIAAGIVFSLDSLLADGSTLDPALRHSCQYYLAAAHTIIGRILAHEGRHEESVPVFEKAASASAESIDRRMYAEALRRLAEAHLAAGDEEAARRSGEEALSVATGVGRETTRSAYLATLGAIELSANRAGRAVRFLEEARRLAVAGDRWMVALDADLLLGHAAAAAGRLDEARDRYREAIRLYERGLGANDAGCTLSGERLPALWADVFDADARIGDIDSLVIRAERSRHRPDRVTASVGERIRACVADRRWIPPGTVLLQYLVTPGELFVVLLDRDRLELERIAVSAAALDLLVGEFAGRCGAGSARGEAALETSGALYRLLVAPVAGAIEGNDALCILRDEPLARLPFGALRPPGPDARWLIETFEISYAPSLLDAARGRSPSPLCYDRPLLVGVTRADPYARRLYPHLVDLPHAEREIQAVRSRFGRCTVLDGAAATRPALLEDLAAGADLVHIASHTVRWPVYDGRTALLLAPEAGIGNERDLRQTLLTAGDIAGIDLDGVALVVLSSCESARGVPGNRFERGIAGAFLDAGAGAVIASLWPVDDASTLRLVTSLYDGLLREGRFPAGALAEARRRLIAEARHAGRTTEALAEWAPFIVAAPPGPGIARPAAATARASILPR